MSAPETVRVLLIDGNAVGFWAYNSVKLSAGSVETQGVFIFVKKLRELLDTFPNATPIIAWDGKSWRETLYADYKGDRESNEKSIKMRDGYRAQRPMMQKAARLLGARQIVAANMEADDLIAMASREARADRRMMIISGDKDLLQLVGPHVSWTDPRSGRLVTHESFTEETGFADTRAYVQAKALIGGDDNIKGVDGVGEKCAQALLAEYGTVEDAIVKLRRKPSLPAALSRFAKKLDAFVAEPGGGVDIWLMNMKLMDLESSAIPKVEGFTDIRGKFSVEGFTQLCEALHFNSILQNMDEWLTPFVKRA